MNSETVKYMDAFIEEVKQHSSYKTLIRLNQAMREDEQVLTAIERFKEAEKSYREAQKYGEYYPDYKKLKKAFIEAKTTLYTHPIVNAYKEAERALEDLLDASAFKLCESISDRIMVKTRLPIPRKKGGVSCSVDKV